MAPDDRQTTPDGAQRETQQDAADLGTVEVQHPVPELVTADDVSPPRGCPFPIVGVGASAGGLEAFTQMLRELPADTGMAYIFVQHLDPHHASQLAEILAAATPMPVRGIENNMPVEQNTVYVLPSNAEVVLRGGRLMLTRRENGPYMPVDRLFHSLATEQGGRSIGIVLSGNDSDGTHGMLAIKGECGVTFAQEESTARFTGMPRNAAATGSVDFILPPQEIARELARLGTHPYVIPPEPGRAELEVLPKGNGEFRKLLSLLKTATGVDFTHYKQTTVRRRIGRRMVVHRRKTLAEYVAFVQRNPGELKELFRDLLIVVTGFFREPDTFVALKELVLKSLTPNRHEPFRIWVPGCATGEEVYSLAICLYEALQETNASIPLQLFGTDISEFALSRARDAVYSNIITQDVSPERLRNFFTKVDSGYQIAKHIRDCCIFARQDVTADPPFSHVDVVSCRNVLIYMNADLQRRVIPIFHYSLKENGLLLLGSAEAIGTFVDLFEPTGRANRIFRRKPAPVRMAIEVMALPDGGAQGPAVRGPAPFTASDLQKRLDRIIQHRYAPNAVAVDAEFHIVQFRGHTSRYLDPQPGEASLNILRMARESLVVPLRRGLRAAADKGISVRENAILKDSAGAEQPLLIEITPIAGLPAQSPYYLIVFDENVSASEPPPAGAPPDLPAAELENIVQQLRNELNDAREQLRNLSEDHAAHLEELQAANEEVRSSNEELQSTNEELGTTKEELQSANEELTTVNEELRNRNQELRELNNDLKNLLSTVNVPILITDNELRMRRFTEAAEKLLDLGPVDVGRRLVHVHGPFPTPTLEHLARRALDTLRSEETEMQDDHGKWFAVSARPFRTTEDRIQGAILSFINIDPLKRGLQAAEQARDYAESLVETVREPLVVLDADLRVRRATSAFYEAFHVTREETEGRFLYDLGNGQWNDTRLRELLGEALFRNTPFQDLEMEHEFPYIGRRTVRVNGRRIPLRDTEPRLVLMAIEDITERKQAAEIQYRRLFEAAKDAIVVLDAENGVITDVNPYTAEMTGYSRETMVGKPINEVEAFRAIDVTALLSEVTAKESARRDGAIVLRRDGREIATDILANGYLVGSQLVVQCNVRDVSDRRRAETALRQSEERFRLFVDSVKDYALFLMDAAGNIVSWNAGAERVLGYREQEILGRASALLFTPEDVERGQPRKELETALREGRAEDERWHIRKDGSRFWGSGVITLVRDESGRLRGFAKIMRDHTERKRAEEEIQSALKEKELLLREIHHRVKNNLQVITSLLNIQATGATGGALASLEQMRDRVRAIARIHELLYKSRSLSGIKMTEHTDALASELLQVYGIDPKRVRVRVDMDDIVMDLERAIPCGLILNELLSNALKHAFPGGRKGVITLTMTLDASYVLTVSDNGVGMAAAIEWPDVKSVGLRLVNIFVEQLQGTIELVRGNGTRFEIRFPAASGGA